MMPLRLTSPTVGLIPTVPLADEGHTIEPSVSVPMATAQRFAEMPAPEPELEPQGLRSSAYGFFVRPPRPLHPLVEWLERILAHSLGFDLARISAPAARSFWATYESFGGFAPTSASEPAVVIMRSAVSILSFSSTGMPCSGPRGPFSLRSLSSASAIARASGLVSITLLMAGPLLSIASIRPRYSSAIERAVYFPDFMPSCSSAMVISSSSNGFTSAGSYEPAARGDAAFSRTSIRGDDRNTGANAAAIPVTAPACKNLRRAVARSSLFTFSGFFKAGHLSSGEFARTHGTPTPKNSATGKLRSAGRRELRSLSCANYFTSIVRVAVLVLPWPSSAVNVYVVVFFGEICRQRSFEGQTLASGGSSFTDFAFDTP